MNRRGYLAVAVASLFTGVTGCLGRDWAPVSGRDGEEGPGTEGGTVAGSGTDDGGETDVPPGSQDGKGRSGWGHTVDPEIRETGQYELAVAVEGGPDGSYPFSVERYDLEMGSNLIVLMDDDDVSIVMEE